MNVEVKTLESAALQEVWNKGECELLLLRASPRARTPTLLLPDQRVEVEPGRLQQRRLRPPLPGGPEGREGRGPGEDLRPARAAAAHGSPLTTRPYPRPGGRCVARERQGLDPLGAGYARVGHLRSSRLDFPGSREVTPAGRGSGPRHRPASAPPVPGPADGSRRAGRGTELRRQRLAGGRMPESIPASLVIDTLKDTFREARAALGGRGRRAADAHAPRLDPERAGHAPEDRAGRRSTRKSSIRVAHLRDRGRGRLPSRRASTSAASRSC